MATFEATREQFNQEHFEVFEISLPVINGTCTLGGELGFGTPLTCDEPFDNDYKTYRFCNVDAPLMADPNNQYYRVIRSISETPTELKPGEGLSSRGSLNVTLVDFKGDPNTETAGVTPEVESNGTFFGKLNARQIIAKKSAVLKLYRVEEDGTIDFTNGAQERFYTMDTLTNNGNGTWTIKCVDSLVIANLNNKVWPPSAGGSLRADIDDTVTAIPVDSDTNYLDAKVVRIGDEFLSVNSVTDNLGPAATLNVATRGNDILGYLTSVFLTKTEATSHESGDEVFICEVNDGQTVAGLLNTILLDSDVPFTKIPLSEWTDETSQWHASTEINTIWSKSESVNTVISNILDWFLMDMWFSPLTGTIKLKAISIWKESVASISDNREILPETMRIKPAERQRATRALVAYNKPYLARSDDVENFTKASLYKDDSLTAPWIYGEHKDKLFSNSIALNKNSADLLVQRYVERFKLQPEEFTFKTEERLLNFDVGDVIDISTQERQGPSGTSQAKARAQVLSIKPLYQASGRQYQVKALSYEPAFPTGSEIVITGTVFDVNLFYQYAGAPGIAVDLTFIFDGAKVGSSLNTVPGITVGPFPTGSTITIIMVNAADLQAKGGDGGTVGEFVGGPLSPGKIGGTCIDCSGTDCEIYFSGATGNANYPTADGYVRAPGGGGGAAVVVTNLAGGGGGAGRQVGFGGFGLPSSLTGQDGTEAGLGGTAGDVLAGDGGDWGLAGDDADLGGDPNNSVGGAAGSGIVDSGGTVNLYGTTAARYINGNGDHP